MKSAFTELLASESREKSGDIRVLDEFLYDFGQHHKLFYPSSALDTRDVLYINGDRLNELDSFSPRIFIHSDAYYIRDTEYILRESQYPSLEFNQKLRLVKNEHQTISLFSVHRASTEFKMWVIHFGGYLNEKILKILMQDETAISVLYTTCDGITHGMGGGFIDSVPTILYPLFYFQLGVRFHITDQGIEKAISIINKREPEQIRRWLRNILSITADQTVSDLLELSDDLLKHNLNDCISHLKESDVNAGDKNRIFNPAGLKIRII